MHEFEATGTVLKGKDYQKGPRYGMNTLRKAVFYRDGYACQACGKTTDEGAILRVHHIGFRVGDHSNRMSNLLTVCTKCHTPANHKPGGKLYDLKPKTKQFTGAAFMNTVRWQMLTALKNGHPDVEWHMTYGVATQESRKILCLAKSHVNDAYAMGTFHPKHRTPFAHFKKLRRNIRILEKFYDVKYVDARDGKTRKGAELSCGRTNRRESRHSEKNLRIYRGQKISKGRRTIRKCHYAVRPGDNVVIDGEKRKAKGIHNKGTRVLLDSGKSVPIKKLEKIIHSGGYMPVK